MKMNVDTCLFAIITALWAALGASGCSHKAVLPPGDPALTYSGETHLRNLRQLTHGGTNAEAYWSFDGRLLTFQHKGPGLPGEHGAGPECDQIYTMTAAGSEITPLSKNAGRTTCSYFVPDDKRVLFSSTIASDKQCPAAPDMSHGYVWPVYPTYQIYSAGLDGSDLHVIEPGAPRAYNAEATVCHDGSVVFTSDRDGDLELYRGQLDRLGTLSQIKRLTSVPGYDGGAFFSSDCKKIVWRASRPTPGKELNDYQGLLKKHLVRPGLLEIWVADADGSHAYQVTRIGAASFAPFFTPDGKSIVFASNPRDPHGRKFDLYKVDIAGTRLERLTFSDTFESFPMFSPDGRYLAFSSNRNAIHPHETNVFVADWVAGDPKPLTLDDPDPANRFLALIQKLSAPDMEGRGVGTRGLGLAEALVTERFSAIGLKPFQESFPKAVGVEGFQHRVDLRIRKTSEILTAHNILGTWGRGCGKTPPVVIGAHLDHLGFGAENSLEPTGKGIHPGADDNASGVAGVLEAAQIIEKDPSAAQGCFVFAAFTGEEVGIAGSSRLVEALRAIKVHPKAMLNLDMVGRMEDNKLIAFGTDSAKEWKAIVTRECEARRLSCPGGGDGYGPSDHMAFYLDGVPVIHFFTGPHLDYHRTTDTSEKINATGGVQASEVVAAVALRAASNRLHFVKAAKPAFLGRASGTKGNGAYLGTIPDYSSLTSPHGPAGGGDPEGGVKLAGTRPGSPAEAAGIKRGDILVSIFETGEASPEKSVEHKIGTLEDFMTALTALKPGQKVILNVRREGALIKLPAVVGRKEG